MVRINRPGRYSELDTASPPQLHIMYELVVKINIE